MFGSDGNTISVSECLAYSNVSRGGNACITNFTSTNPATDSENRTFGPLPVSVTISNLVAKSGASGVSGARVAILDNGAETALSCTIGNSLETRCDNNVTTVTVEAGHWLQVEVSAATLRAWQAMFVMTEHLGTSLTGTETETEPPTEP